MPSARLGVAVPEGTWIRAVSTAHPDATFRVVSALAGSDGGVAQVELHAPDPVAVLAAIDAHHAVTDLELLRAAEDWTLVQVETTDPKLLGPLRGAGVPLATPFDVTDGEAAWELTTTADRLSALGDRLDDAGVRFRIDAVTSAEARDGAGPPLTDRQRRAVLAAHEHGYYDTPRTTTLTELAEAMDVSKSTASDVLHRAEGHLVEWVVEESLAEPRSGPRG